MDQPSPAPGVRGHARAAFRPAVESFAKLVTRGRGGGALVVRLRGETVVDLCTGWTDRAHTRPWKPETLALSFSTTKGIASTVIHRLAERGELAYDEPVATYWPEFAAGGKGRVTVRDLLTHRAGLWSVRASPSAPRTCSTISRWRNASPPATCARRRSGPRTTPSPTDG